MHRRRGLLVSRGSLIVLLQKMIFLNFAAKHDKRSNSVELSKNDEPGISNVVSNLPDEYLHYQAWLNDKIDLFLSPIRYC
jgi:hypothetical protein